MPTLVSLLSVPRVRACRCGRQELQDTFPSASLELCPHTSALLVPVWDGAGGPCCSQGPRGHHWGRAWRFGCSSSKLLLSPGQQHQPLPAKILPHPGWEKLQLGSGEVSWSQRRDFPFFLLLPSSQQHPGPSRAPSALRHSRTSNIFQENCSCSCTPGMLTLLGGPRSCSSAGESRGEALGGLEGPSALALGDSTSLPPGELT